MAESKPNFIKKNPWLFATTGAVMLLYILYVAMQNASYKRLTEMHPITLQEVEQKRPTEGTYSVTGGWLNFVYAQAVGFANDPEKDAGSHYDSYVPCMDPKTQKVVMLVKIPGESPATLLIHRDDPPENSLIGFFQDPRSVEPEIYQDFANRKYSVPPDLPVMELSGGPDEGALHRRITVAGVLAVIAAGGPWALMYLLNRPKKPKKRFSERYPERRIY